MTDLEDGVAVVTGAASGIGRAMADRFAAEGMRVVLADVEERPLATAVRELEAAGAVALGVACDVRSPASVDELRERTVTTFGAPRVVCLNAGVGPIGPVVETSLDTWRWLVEVNLMGVVHGVHAFAPAMVEADEGHLVLTASAAGLIASPLLGPYSATKHAVVGLAEALCQELTGTGVGVSVVCPALVRTGIFDSERNRPAELGGVGANRSETAEVLRAALDSMGMAPEVVAEEVLKAVRDDRFYVLPHPEVKDLVRTRMEGIIEDRNPQPLWSNPTSAPQFES